MPAEAAQIHAAEDLSIRAGGDIDFDRLQLAKFREVKGWSIGFSFPGSGIVDALAQGEGASGALNALADTIPVLAAVKRLKGAKGPGQVIGAAANLALTGADVLGSGLNSFKTAVNGGTIDAFTNGLANSFNPFANPTFGITFSKFKSR